MQRESDTHSPRQDDNLKHELEGMLRGGGPTHAEEWRDAEPPADDDPVLHDPLLHDERRAPGGRSTAEQTEPE